MMLTVLVRCDVKGFSQKEKRKGKAVGCVRFHIAAAEFLIRTAVAWKGVLRFQRLRSRGGWILSDGHTVADTGTVVVGHRVEVHRD